MKMRRKCCSGCWRPNGQSVCGLAASLTPPAGEVTFGEPASWPDSPVRRPSLSLWLPLVGNDWAAESQYLRTSQSVDIRSISGPAAFILQRMCVIVELHSHMRTRLETF
ncbi:hypothetical protein V2G26_006446 [Clonostachys chloroleuca]